METLEAGEQLRYAGFDMEQSEAVLKAFNTLTADLATKHDFLATNDCIDVLKEDFGEFRTETHNHFDAIGHQFVAVNNKIEALRNEMNAGFVAMDQRFTAIDARFTAVDARFTSMETRFNGMDARFNDIDAHFITLDKRFNGLEKRLDTLPGQIIWKMYTGIGIGVGILIGFATFWGQYMLSAINATGS